MATPSEAVRPHVDACVVTESHHPCLPLPTACAANDSLACPNVKKSNICPFTPKKASIPLLPTLPNPKTMSFKPMRIQQPPKCTQHQPVLLKTTQNQKNRPFWSLLTGLMMPEHSQSYLHSTSIPHATSLAYVPILHILFRHCNADVVQKSDSMLNATVTAIMGIGTTRCIHTPSPSLNWDQDPRLHDLSNALKALSWFRH